MSKTIVSTVLVSLTPLFVVGQNEKPNVILILVDDMGFSDVGCYGSEIPTPNIDALAKSGVKFKHFYNASRSCPTRASLLTGLYQHQTGVGMMTTEAGNNFDFGVDGYRGYLNKNCVTIAEVLKASGYHTYMTGKWHLGSDSLWKRPLQRGFERFYGSYQGAFSYFDPKGDRCLIDQADTVKAPPGFYSTDVFTDKAIEYISEQSDNKPFFLYLAYNAPHWPLQAKEEDIAVVKSLYKNGWDSVRNARFAKQKSLKLWNENVIMSDRDTRVRPWNALSEKEKNESIYRMSVYAAQVYAIDRNIGKLTKYLKTNCKMDNTLIIFLSDNGACAEPYRELGGGKFSDINNPEQSGAISYGIGWANVSNTPYKSYKANTYEGGISTPFIVSWPASIKARPSSFNASQGHIVNIMPTILEAVGAEYPAEFGLSHVQPIQAVSLLNVIKKKQSVLGEYQYWEHTYNCAVTKGYWKAISRLGTEKWVLFNLETDPTELNDVAGQYPDVLNDLIKHWQKWSKECKVLPKGNRTPNSYD